MKHQLTIAITFLAVLLLGLSSCQKQAPQVQPFSAHAVGFDMAAEAFPIFADGQAVQILLSENDYPGVHKVAIWFGSDIKKLTGSKPNMGFGVKDAKAVILIGTLGKSQWIDQLAQAGKMDTTLISGKWEASLVQTIDRPFEGVEQALVIAGSDKRGTIYGMMQLSRYMGVSPWHFWADVPVAQRQHINLKNGIYLQDSPKVKYRGIFLNDEEPALGRWASNNYGGFNHQFYEKVFELLLRQRANFLWPAMWWAAFGADDPLNPQLADELGIVMSNSHHEPMMRAHAEWRAKGPNKGAWNYATNADSLQQFWREGIQRMGKHESIVTLAMRGDGDEAMSAETNTELLENIVKDQRQIIEEVTGKPAAETPQVWALYKEVQDYYDHGMRVPDDVTLLLCDDNWGNIRKLPQVDAPARAGGYGIYYHFDYVGGPRNYKWINTNPLPKIWEQMGLAYQHGVDRIWLVNVGDLKPMELPIAFFLDYAWNPETLGTNELDAYPQHWATEQFGAGHAAEIGDILKEYTKYNGRRKPELLDWKTYSLDSYREFERVSQAYTALADKTKALYAKIPAKQKDAFYQLVFYPVVACANLYELYYNTALNHRYAAQQRSATNTTAQRVAACFAEDQKLTDYYHHQMSGGKWDRMMAQNHIGYTYWQEPREQKMPEVFTLDLPQTGTLRVAVEGSQITWPNDSAQAALPVFDSFNQQKPYIELYNTGLAPLAFELKASQPWVKVSARTGGLQQERIFVSVDFEALSTGTHTAKLVVESPTGRPVNISLKAIKHSADESQKASGFVANNGVVSIEAHHYLQANNGQGIKWTVIPGLGRTGSGVTAMPQTISLNAPTEESPTVQYPFYLLDTPTDGKVQVQLIVSPTLDFYKQDLLCAVAIDGGMPELLNLQHNKEHRYWQDAVSNNCYTLECELNIATKGKHTLDYYLVSGGVVLQKIIINNGGLKPSYLGPVESMKNR